MHSIDILIFALIAIFLVLRLFSVLGKKNESSTLQSSSKEFDAPNNKSIKDVEIINKTNLSQEEQLQILDPSFTTSDFLKKAKTAYEMVFHAYADGNTHVLSELVEIDVMRKLAYSITQREEKNYKCKITSFKHKSTSVKSISLKNTMAKAIINIESELVFYIEDKSNKVVTGSKTKVDKIVQELHFVRNISSTDPTWKINKISNIPF